LEEKGRRKRRRTARTTKRRSRSWLWPRDARSHAGGCTLASAVLERIARRRGAVRRGSFVSGTRPAPREEVEGAPASSSVDASAGMDVVQRRLMFEDE
jgi:hypothetical protein